MIDDMIPYQSIIHPHKWTQHQDHQKGFCRHSSTNYLVPAQISRRDTPCIQVQQPPHHETLARSLQDQVAPESTRNSSFIRDHSVYVFSSCVFVASVENLINDSTIRSRLGLGIIWENQQISLLLDSSSHPFPMQKSNLTRFLIVLEIFYKKNGPII